MGKLIAYALGPAGSASVLAFVFRHWFGEKLRELAKLKSRVAEDRLWKAMASQRFEAQAAEIDRLSRNLHHLKNYAGAQANALHLITQRLQDRGIELELVELAMPQWDVAQLPPVALPAEVIESKGEEEEEP